MKREDAYSAGAEVPQCLRGNRTRFPLLVIPFLAALAFFLAWFVPVYSQESIIWDGTDEYNCDLWSFGCTNGNITVPYSSASSSFYVQPDSCEDAALFVHVVTPTWLLVQDSSYTEVLSITPESGVGTFEVGLSITAWESMFTLTQTPWYSATEVDEFYIVCYDVPAPTPTPEPVLEETIIGPDGAYIVEHRITWGDIGVVASLLLVAGLEVLHLFSKVPSWLRH